MSSVLAWEIFNYICRIHFCCFMLICIFLLDMIVYSFSESTPTLTTRGLIWVPIAHLSTMRKYDKLLEKSVRNANKKPYKAFYCTSDKFLPIKLPEMYHIIAPYQRIVYPLRLMGGNGRRCELSNKTMTFNEPGFRYLSSSYTIRKIF